ncbi:MAG: hypothetical protein FWD68_01960 [Alphaproteobacteria bacterium]|nr:hypothetical protein [Alphaproteobacteria bacterium]
MSFDLPRALWRIRPQRTAVYRRRAIDALPIVGGAAWAGPQLLLDTCVYIDVLQSRTPDVVDELLDARIINHSTICLAEMTHLLGRLDPTHGETSGVVEALQQTVGDIADHRLSAPSKAALGEAGMLAGLVSRLFRIGRTDRAQLLNDASLYLQAVECGWTILTRNVANFDCLEQVLPENRILFYEQQS